MVDWRRRGGRMDFDGMGGGEVGVWSRRRGPGMERGGE